MTDTAWILAAVTALAMVADWVAVGVGSRPGEWVAKPAATAGLIAVAVALPPADGTIRGWFVAALVLSLAGDVALLVEHDRPGPTWFVAGLGSFLLAHVAYVVGLALADPGLPGFLLGVLLMATVLSTVGRRIVQGAAETEPALRLPVIVYMLVISAMVSMAIASGDGDAAVGAALFAFSDSLIAWNRFVLPFGWARVGIMVTYHLGQAGLVASLV